MSNDLRSDSELIADANRGDSTAFEALYCRYRDWVVRLAFRFIGNQEDALDVLQDTFVYFFGRFPGFELRAQLKTFLYPAVKNLSLTRLRKSGRQIPLSEGESDLPAPSASSPSLARSELENVLHSLSPGEREVVMLRFFDDFTLQEIAEALGIPVGTVKSRLHNALAALRSDPSVRKFFET